MSSGSDYEGYIHDNIDYLKKKSEEAKRIHEESFKRVNELTKLKTILHLIQLSLEVIGGSSLIGVAFAMRNPEADINNISIFTFTLTALSTITVLLNKALIYLNYDKKIEKYKNKSTTALSISHEIDEVTLEITDHRITREKINEIEIKTKYFNQMMLNEIYS